MKARRNIFLTIVLILSMAFYAYAADPDYVEPGYNGSISDTTASVGVAAASLFITDAQGRGRPAREAWFIVETAAVNFTVDGTTATTAATTNVGASLPAGGYVILKGLPAISGFRCINRVASSGAVVKYFVFY